MPLAYTVLQHPRLIISISRALAGTIHRGARKLPSRRLFRCLWRARDDKRLLRRTMAHGSRADGCTAH